MEENQIPETPAPTTAPEHVEHHADQPKEPMPKWPFAVIAALVVLVALLGGYLFLSKQSNTTAPTPTPTVSQDQTQNPNLSPGEPKTTTAPTKTYTSAKLSGLSFSGYTLNHPVDWSESEEKTDVSTKLTLTKGTYSITILQTPTEGSLCAYKDSDVTADNPFISDKRGKPYIDITTGFGSLRRNLEAVNGKTTFTFCQKSTTDDSYGSFTKIGIITYNTPNNADEKTLTEMDNILLSVETK